VPPSWNRAALGLLLAPIFVAGVCTLVAYAKLCRNSFSYYLRANEYEDFARKASPELSQLHSLEDYRGHLGRSAGETRLGTINAWRLGALAAMDTAVAGSAAALVAIGRGAGCVMQWSWLACIFSVALHVTLYLIIMDGAGMPPPTLRERGVGAPRAGGVSMNTSSESCLAAVYANLGDLYIEKEQLEIRFVLSYLIGLGLVFWLFYCQPLPVAASTGGGRALLIGAMALLPSCLACVLVWVRGVMFSERAIILQILTLRDVVFSMLGDCRLSQSDVFPEVEAARRDKRKVFWSYGIYAWFMVFFTILVELLLFVRLLAGWSAQPGPNL
jgi:hypothetical protein